MAREAFILKESALLSFRALKSLLTLICAAAMLLLLPFRGPRRVSPAEKPSSKEECHRKGAMVRMPAKMVPRKSGVGVVVARRELAIRRVVEDDDQRCVREYWILGTKRGDTIFTQCWTPVYHKIRGLVLLLHGLNEHSSRYSDFAKQLNANGYKVYGMDWSGHGGSDGLHAYVHSLDDAVSDMALLDPKVEARIVGATFTSPAVGVEPSHPILVALAPILSFLLPTYECNSAYKKGLPVCRDPEALHAKYSDPLVCTGSLRIRTGYEILRITTYLQQNFRKLRVPFQVLHGTADSVTDPDASRKLYEQASSTDKTIKLYEGFSHDLLFEPERENITRDIIQWLNSRI
ncbi:uncharacterized protein LOC114182507 isoform X2 [Vigna unguiculata]|uniref:uncharacterized protein LOC114182507 isoform X2 n=1 Tax=Vigna unguiculata TaxID=3917 RepID=UPI0010163719|nr:uncharacterized protein LOC114182507 isoform X2 [Vigna unguiculata]